MSAITRVKICGLTSVDQALEVAALGADAIGLVFHKPSSRSVNWQTAKLISDALPPFVQTVGLFVDASDDEVRKVLAHVHLDILQFHGNESPEYCRQFGKPYIKAVHVKPLFSMETFIRRYPDAKAFLLDTYDKNLAGGTGTAFNWGLFPEQVNVPLILAGGLDPDNVAEAIIQCKPYAVDVSSGVENNPGDKSMKKIKSFVNSAKHVEC